MLKKGSSKKPEIKAKGKVIDNTSLEENILDDLDDSQFAKEMPKVLQTQNAKEANHMAFVEKVFSGEIGGREEKLVSRLADFFWEYVIVMYNPDYQGQENKAVTDEEAKLFYKKCFKPRKTGSLHKDRLNFLHEVQAFEKTFKKLNDINNGKCIRYGGRLSISGENVIDFGGPTKDFSTLVRNAVFYKLVGSLGLKVRQIVSRGGEYIFLLITADEADLQIEAERTRFNKQLEIALTDIQSLVPCDQSLRPMHILKTNDDDIKRLYRDVKPFFRKAFNLEKNTERVDYKYEPEGVTMGAWSTYKIYLTLIKEGIEKIEAVQSHKNQMFLFQKLLKDSLEKANQNVPRNDKLKNLWDQMDIFKPIPPYAEYRRSGKEDEFNNMWRTHEIDESGKRSLFRGMERIRLLVSYIETEIGLNFLQEQEYILAHYPLHNNWQLKGKETNIATAVSAEDLLLKNVLYNFKPVQVDGPLMTSWSTSLINQKIPLSKIRNYFGEKIALYFEFLRYYQVSLLLPAFIGLGVFIVQRLLNDEHIVVQILNAAYSVFMTIWATIYLEGWKRREASLSIMWGTTKYEQVEVPRPQYKGVLRRSPITDEMDEIYFDSRKRVKYFMLAMTVSLLILSLVIGIVAGLIILKWRLSEDLLISGIDLAGPVCSILNAIQIQVFNIIYAKLAKILTDMENHKTENQYQDSLILKVFAFQFVNAYNSLCYIAFAKSYFEGCIVTEDGKKVKKIGESCMDELYTQLISIFIVSYVKNIVELGIPFIKYQMRKRKKAQAKIMSQEVAKKDIRGKIEAQLYLEYYVTTDKDGTIDDYMELAVQFGYLSLFARAFPLSATLTFLGLWFEMFTDKLKILRLVRRPIPLASKDIGTWLNIFSVVCVFAIFSNTALFCFTAPTFKNWEAANDYSYIIFALVVVGLLIFRSQIQSWIPDVPEKFEIVQARHDFIVERVLRGTPKTEFQEDEETFDMGIYFASSEGSRLKTLDI
ncbi:hypothetical protein SteCoe_6192 [Stentor coeruleus]|uniref:Anoctamin transmembrane domain-containing protein n=1 Tax=Stentor coeruleus TaxID=5963 RepID=A0A1R2CQP8_9CILI|nr:hypothetical protein SteCoe_6192 [Stentor coeruleus]